ncbi:MAG: cbb3-type cytochrome c oxidase subunit II [Verrucomicrobiales bacterium]|nr:cbb3-type cytochrome c oxidase subunit II [Verrucomicrobiales bacterium]
MRDFRKFVLCLVLTFGLPWLLMVIIPVLKYQHLEPVPYDKAVDGMDGYYPPAGIQHRGKIVYVREGCVQCHSQMIRPAQLAMDAWHRGWGADQSPRPESPIRANTMRDYLGEKVAMLGLQRVGPDLANAGYRFENRMQVHMQLYAPRADADWSVMPAYRHLYTVQKMQGPKSDLALPLMGRFAPKKGYEVVPKAEAEALVDYILSLKKDWPIPGETARLAAAAEAAKAAEAPTP